MRWTLRGGTIVDGTGRPAFIGDVVIEGGRITNIGPRASAGHVCDVSDRVVAPGFIDIHSHVDWIVPLREGATLLAPNLRQGITTSVGGNCGMSPAPIARKRAPGAVECTVLARVVSDKMEWSWRSVRDFFAHVERRRLPMNFCMLVGHSTLRATVMGHAQRAPTHFESIAMRHHLRASLREGAVGLSAGLEYFPGRYARPMELEALATELKSHDAPLAIHTRGISALYEQGMDEALKIAEESSCQLQIAHVNPMGRANWDAADGLMKRIDAARARGLDVGYDIVLYVAWNVSALELLPHFVQDLGVDAVLALAGTAHGRTELRRLTEKCRPSWPPWISNGVTRNIPIEMGWENLILAEPAAPGFDDFRGKTIASLAGARRCDPYDVYFDLLTQSRGTARIVNVGYAGDFENDAPLRRLATRRDAIPETDTVPVPVPGGDVDVTLPMSHGTMARFLGHFSRDLGIVSLEEAVHRITQAPAKRMRLTNRGVLRAGAFADLTVFDPLTIGDRGSHLDPQPPAGIEHVFVNGEAVVRDGSYDPELRPGRVLRRAA